MTQWWATPVETRWPLLNWPGSSRLAVLFCYFVAVNWLIFAPARTFEEVPPFFAHQDKVIHAAIFLTLAWLVRWSVPTGASRERVDRRLRYGVPLALALYSCSTELLQPLIGGKGRQFEWLDMASNFAGLCAGWLLFAQFVGPLEAREF